MSTHLSYWIEIEKLDIHELAYAAKVPVAAVTALMVSADRADTVPLRERQAVLTTFMMHAKYKSYPMEKALEGDLEEDVQRAMSYETTRLFEKQAPPRLRDWQVRY